MSRGPAIAGRHERYWLGYRHGRRLAIFAGHLRDHEPILKLEVQLASQRHRAFALGELRGYRQAMGYPQPVVEGHRLSEPFSRFGSAFKEIP